MQYIHRVVSPIYSKLDGFTPAALYGFVKVKNMSHKEEVKLLIGVRDTIDRLLPKSVVEIREDGTERQISDAIRLDQLRRKFDENLLGNTFNHTSFSRRRLLDSNNYTVFSIAGGFPRNELLGLSHLKTDVDVICQEEYMSVDVLSMCFKQLPSENTSVRTFEIPDNTMHTIYYPFYVQKRRFDEAGRELSPEVMHVFVNPLEFDFTINCASISNTDGWLYAPPATLHDIENKILRPTVQFKDDYHISMLLKLPLLIRSIRFALKYDMEMHNDLYTAMKVYFKLQSERKNTDDKSMYHGLKHLLDDDKSLRDEFYSVFRKLNVYETEKFATFDEYFNYITERKETEPRENKLVVAGGSGFHY